jgi:phage tail sheath protein FI
VAAAGRATRRREGKAGEVRRLRRRRAGIADTVSLAFEDYLRATLARGLAWTASEQNGETLWARVREQVDALLYSRWRSGELVGATKEQAFYVRCDRTTMTQNDLDNGRLIVLVGVATVEPAEFTPIEITLRVGRRRAPR